MTEQELRAIVRETLARHGAGRMPSSPGLASGPHAIPRGLCDGGQHVHHPRFPRPIVAIVRGRALAGGAGLATACDIVVAAESSRFGYPEMQRGFVPAMVMTLLRRQVGEKAAFDLVATGRVVDAPEAHALGLVTRVVTDERLHVEASELVAQLALASPTAMHLTKKLFYELDGQSFEESIALGARVNALARTTPEFRAAIAKFLAS